MQDVQALPPFLDREPKHQMDGPEAPSAPATPTAPAQPNMMYVMMMVVFDALLTTRQSAQIQTKEIQHNVDEQNNLINLERQLKFQTIPKNQLFTNYFTLNGAKFGKLSQPEVKPGAADLLQQMQFNNQEVNAQRNVLEDQLISRRQSFQIQNAYVDADADLVNEKLSVGTGLMSTVTSITNQINK
jgi:hypothetical protein